MARTRLLLVPGLLGLAGLWGCGSTSSVDPGFLQLGAAGAGGDGGSASGSTTTTTTGSSSTADGGAPAKGPPYPIVLAHGFFGFDDLAGLDFADYFYHVKEHLAEAGETLVFTPAVDPFNSSEVRGAQLAEKIKGILAATGYAKCNIVGHSQGGLDARVVAHDHPDLVASVITLQTPHGGTPIADIALGLIDDPNKAALVDALVKAVGAPLYDEIGAQTSVAASFAAMSEDGIAAFNASYPDQPGIYYASIAGRSDWHQGGKDCQTDASPPFVAAFADELDPIDPLLAVSEMILDGGVGDPYPNDGLMRAKDARRGVFLGCLPADHFDMVGQLLGDKPGMGNDWDYLQFYVDLIQHIRDHDL